MNRECDKPTEVRRRTVVVVGGGFSGTSLAVQLLRQDAGRRLRVILVERSAAVGRGLAYGQADPQLLLNAPAGNMSAFASEPDDFVDHCRRLDGALCGASFVPRWLYGDYLKRCLHEVQRSRPGQLQCLKAEVVAVRPAAGGLSAAALLDDGSELSADAIVLALGHAAPRDPLPPPGLPALPQVVSNPWHLPALDALPHDRPVLLIGTGHTAVDVAFRLLARVPERHVLMVSRHGLLPHGHRAKVPPRRPPAVAAVPMRGVPVTVRSCLRVLRDQARQSERLGGDWHDVVNALRPRLPALWRALSVSERRRFLRHLLAYWDIHRHRLAPAASARLQALLAANRIEVIAGRLLECRADGEALQMRLRRRGAGEGQVLEVGSVVNCAGPRSALDDPCSALARQLAGDGLMQRDVLGLGVHVDDGYRLLDRHGVPVAGLHYIGPGLKADHWEAVAVPELRVHVQALAAALGAAVEPSTSTTEGA